MEDDHIRARVGQVEYLGQHMMDWGIPIVRPIGGHAVFLDARAIYAHIAHGQYPAQALAAGFAVLLASSLAIGGYAESIQSFSPGTGQRHSPMMTPIGGQWIPHWQSTGVTD